MSGKAEGFGQYIRKSESRSKEQEKIPKGIVSFYFAPHRNAIDFPLALRNKLENIKAKPNLRELTRFLFIPEVSNYYPTDLAEFQEVSEGLRETVNLSNYIFSEFKKAQCQALFGSKVEVQFIDLPFSEESRQSREAAYLAENEIHQKSYNHTIPFHELIDLIKTQKNYL